jgi:hypothetical protein
MKQVADKSADLTFSSHLLADVPPSARDEYLRQIRRFTRGYVINVAIEQPEADWKALADAFDRSFELIEKRNWDWNVYRAPDAKEWQHVYRPRW